MKSRRTSKLFSARLYRRLLHLHDNLGLRGLVGLRRMPDLPERAQAVHPFDLAHGTDTSGVIPGEQLATGARADLYNTAYYAISPSTLSAALKLIPAALDPCTFVDLGCGKGRALLVAGSAGFARVVGVELSGPLCGVARQNTASEPRITVVNEDAQRFVYPPGPLVVFLYHPFLKPVLRRALANLKKQLREQPRPVWLLYANATYPRLMARSGFLDLVWDVNLPLSVEDAAADRHGILTEHYTLYRAVVSGPG